MFLFRRKQKPAEAPTRQTPAPFVWASRRRYRADVPYILPNDIDDANRLDFQRHMVRAVRRGALYGAPVRQPLSILDVGTGTGRWAREMAQIFPQANVIGIDLKGAPMQTGTQTTGENVTFVQGNLLEGLPFAANTFDLVHQRFLISGIPEQQWPAAIHELLRVTNPGGWIELTEAGLSQNNGPALHQLDAWVGEVLSRRNLDIQLGSRIDTFLRGAGLHNVSMHTLPVPIGAYGGRLGTLAEKDYFAAILAMRDLIVAQGIATAATYDDLVAQAQQEVEYGHVTWAVYVAFGRKPR